MVIRMVLSSNSPWEYRGSSILTLIVPVESFGTYNRLRKHLATDYDEHEDSLGYKRTSHVSKSDVSRSVALPEIDRAQLGFMIFVSL